MEENNATFKRNALLVGGVLGALVGIMAANVIVKSAENEAAENDSEVAITPAKGLKLGMLVLGLLRQISDI